MGRSAASTGAANAVLERGTMLGKVQRHVRQQLVGYFALFVALGGVSYAAVALPKNSVSSKQIKNGQVKGVDLAKNAVTSAKVKNGSLRASDFKLGDLPAGAPGATGPTGATGATGATGQVDTSNFYDKATSDGRFLSATGKAADADKLDGIDSTGFVAAGEAGAGMQSARINTLPAVSPGIDTRYGAINGISTAGTSSSMFTMISPAVAVVARDLAVNYTVGVTGGNRVATLVVNGTDSALSCMVFPQGSPAQTCTDTADRVSIPAGSALVFKVTTSALNPFTVPATDAMISWRAT